MENEKDDVLEILAKFNKRCLDLHHIQEKIILMRIARNAYMSFNNNDSARECQKEIDRLNSEAATMVDLHRKETIIEIEKLNDMDDDNTRGNRPNNLLSQMKRRYEL